MEEGKKCSKCRHFLSMENFRIKRNGQMLRQCIKCLDANKASRKRTKCRASNRHLHENKELMAILRAHIEAKFSEGMTWEDYEFLHIDHKVPYKYQETGKSPTLADVARALHQHSRVNNQWRRHVRNVDTFFP